MKHLWFLPVIWGLIVLEPALIWAQSASVVNSGPGAYRAYVASPHGALMEYGCEGQAFTYGPLYGKAFVTTPSVPASQSSKNPVPAIPATTRNYQTQAAGWAAFNKLP